MDRFHQFEVYKQTLARMEKRNQLIIKALRSRAYEQALLWATTPADMVLSELDFKTIHNNVVRKPVGQLELDL